MNSASKKSSSASRVARRSDWFARNLPTVSRWTQHLGLVGLWFGWSWRRRAVVVALAASLVALMLYHREPRHEGRSLSRWLELENGIYSSDDFAGDTASVSNALIAMCPQAPTVLVDWLETRDSRMRKAFAALAGRQSVLNFEIEGADSRRSLAVAGFRLLGSNAAPVIPRIAMLIEDPELGDAAFTALNSIGVAARGQLMAALTNHHPHVRRSAMSCLAREPIVDEPEVLTALIHLMQDTNPTVATDTVHALVRMNRHIAIVHGEAARLAARPDYPGRGAAISALVQARADVTMTLPLYLQAMNDPLPQTRRWAVLGLGQVKSESVMKRLMAALSDPDSIVRARSAKNLGAYREHSPAIISKLVVLLTNDLPAVRASVAGALASFGSEASIVVPHLVSLYRDGKMPPISDAAARALLAIDTNTAIQIGIVPSQYQRDSLRGRHPPVARRPPTNY